MAAKEFWKKIFSPMLWGNLLLMGLVAVLLSIGVWLGLSYYTHHGEEIIVPDVCNKLIGDADYTLEMAGLSAIVVDSTYNRSLPSGAVMTQHPEAGSKVKAGRHIYLTINSKESPSVSLPDIADNCSMREAKDRLTQLGFRIGPVEYVPGDKDWVYGVKCQGRTVATGERVPIDAVITLLVGNDHVDEETEADTTLSSDATTETDVFDYE